MANLWYHRAIMTTILITTTITVTISHCRTRGWVADVYAVYVEHDLVTGQLVAQWHCTTDTQIATTRGPLCWLQFPAVRLIKPAQIHKFMVKQCWTARNVVIPENKLPRKGGVSQCWTHTSLIKVAFQQPLSSPCHCRNSSLKWATTAENIPLLSCSYLRTK